MPSQRSFLGISHTPLFGLNPVARDVQRQLESAIEMARATVSEFDPDLVLLVAPDHYNGFFNELMPPFCIGTSATAVGDYLSPAGPLNVGSDAALQLASYLMDTGFDVAVSRRMSVDHGFSQAIQFLWGNELRSPPVVPIFMNAAAPPGIPRIARCLSLGRAIGDFLDTLPCRTLLIGSGGLSHDPPVPTLAHPDPDVRERITVRNEPTHAQRYEKQERVMAAGIALANGTSGMKPLNPEWDRCWMNAIEDGNYSPLLAMSEDSIESQAGMSGHESKTWLIARAALAQNANTRCTLRHYQAIPEYIAGFGVMYLERT